MKSKPSYSDSAKPKNTKMKSDDEECNWQKEDMTQNNRSLKDLKLKRPQIHPVECHQRREHVGMRSAL